MQRYGSSSTLDSSYSFGEGEKSTSAPLFVFIAADKEFKKPTLPGAHCHAVTLEGKMFRKVGPSKVISLTEATSSGTWGGTFEHPSATLHMLYRKHPVNDNRYIGVKYFHDIIFEEKCNEFCEIMRVLGAKSIKWMGRSPWVRNYESPGSYSPFFEEEKYPFLQHSGQWQAIVQERTTSWPDSIQIEFCYDDHYSVNDEKIAILLKKLSLPPSAFFGHDITSIKSDSSGDGSSSASHCMFTPSTSPVEVIFFSRSDFEKINRDRVCKQWGPEHVESLLIRWGMDSLVPLVTERSVSISSLLNCKKARNLEDLLSSSSKDRAQVCELFMRLSMLGQLDEQNLIEQVESAAKHLVETRLEKRLARENADIAAKLLQEEKNRDREIKPIAVKPLDITKLTAADYSLVVIGCGGVGKTSLLKFIMKSSDVHDNVNTEFDVGEHPSVGPKLYECSAGHVKIECWDTPGQDSELGGVLLYTRRADIIFVVYDVSSIDSFNSLEMVVAAMDKNGLLPWTTACLIGNKIDLGEPSRKVDMENAIKFARKYKFSNFFETSAKTGLNVNICLSNALLKCEQGKRDADERKSFDGAIRVGTASEQACIDDRELKSSGKCAC